MWICQICSLYFSTFAVFSNKDLGWDLVWRPAIRVKIGTCEKVFDFFGTSLTVPSLPKKKQAEVWPTVQSLLTSAWLDLNVLMESKYSMPWVRCAFGNFLFFIPTTSSTVKLENSSLHYLQNNISCRRRPIKVTVQAGRAQPQKDKAWASAIQVKVDRPACDSVCFITNYIKISYSSLPLL